MVLNFLSIKTGQYQYGSNLQTSTLELLDSQLVEADRNGFVYVAQIVKSNWPRFVVHVMAFASEDDLERTDYGTLIYSGTADTFIVVVTAPLAEVYRDHSSGHSTIAKPQLETVYIPAGAFQMGADDNQLVQAVEECNRTEGNCRAEWFASEKPLRSVYVNAFRISKYEVTNRDYAQCVSAGVCAEAGRAITDDSIAYSSGFFAAQKPVVGVTWHDANTFCAWAGGRLPTETEWEKAARGTDARRYPWGNQYSSGLTNLGLGYPTAVGAYPASVSPYGVQDMAGNAFEWTATADGARYVLRGGSWLTDYFRGRVTDRGTKLSPNFANYDIGFRCAFD